MTTELLTRVLDAHGGVERWQQFTRIEATIVSGGLMFEDEGHATGPDAAPHDRHAAA